MAAKTRHKKSAVKIQHCPISSKFDMWVDNDVPNWFLPFSKWPPQYRTNSTMFDFNEISYIGRLWCPELIPRHRKISTDLHFQNGHHNTAKIQHCSISKVAFDLFFSSILWHKVWVLIYVHIWEGWLFKIRWNARRHFRFFSIRFQIRSMFF